MGLLDFLEPFLNRAKEAVSKKVWQLNLYRFSGYLFLGIDLSNLLPVSTGDVGETFWHFSLTTSGREDTKEDTVC